MKRLFRQYASGISNRQLFVRILIGVVAIAGVAVLLYALGRKAELQNAGQEERGDLTGRFVEPRTIDFNGITYQYREGLTTILVMGIDNAEQGAGESMRFRNGGQADFLLLLVFDSKARTVTPIHIDRDTMTEITVLGVLGNEVGTRNAQISLSHGFGDGGAQSSRYTVDAVSKLLYGADIDFYISLDLSAISVINDALGGVTVTLKDDFTPLDPAMTKGSTITLQGPQAEYFVRSRMSIGIGTNEARMERQREYLANAGTLLGQKLHEDGGFIGTLFDDLGKHLLTDMKRGRMINEFYGSRDYEKKDIVTPAGNHIVGQDRFMEFHADEASLEEMVIHLFFIPREGAVKRPAIPPLRALLIEGGNKQHGG